MPNHVPLNELAVAVQNAVEQALAQKGLVSIEKLWVGFVAPDAVANIETAGKIAAVLGKEAHVPVQPAVAQQIAAPPTAAHGAQHTEALVKPGHIIGLVFSPRA